MDWSIFLSTFVLLFVAELGDKAELTVISMVSRHGHPGTVFVAAVGALALVTPLGVLGSRALCRLVLTALLRKASPMWF